MMENKYTKHPKKTFINNKYTKAPVQSKFVTVIMTIVLFFAVAGTAIFAILLSPSNLSNNSNVDNLLTEDIVLRDWDGNARFMAAVADELGVKYGEKETKSLADALSGIDESKYDTITSLDLSGMQLRNIPSVLQKFTNLTQLNLSNNFLMELPDFLINNQSLQINVENNLLSSEKYDYQYSVYVTESLQELYDSLSVSKLYDESAILATVHEYFWVKATTSYGTTTKSPLYEDAKFEIVYSENIDGFNGKIEDYVDLNTGTIFKSGVVSGEFKLVGAPDNSPNLKLPFQISLEADLSALVSVSIWEDNQVFIDYLISKFNLKSIDQLTKPMLESLNEIQINNPELKTLPNGVVELTSLKKIDVSGSGIKEFPDLSSISGLEEINISNTNINYIPMYILQLKNLQSLDISNNNFSELPYEIGDMTGLRYLYLNNNSLTYLPDSMTRLNNLFKLDISDNSFSYLPTWFSGYKNFILLAKNNNLSNIPQEFAGMSMVSLDISGNNFSKIPDVLFEINQLSNLEANDNQIIDISKAKDGWNFQNNLLGSKNGTQRKIVVDNADVQELVFEFKDLYNEQKILNEIVPKIKLSDGTEIFDEYKYEVVLEEKLSVVGSQYVDIERHILQTSKVKAYVSIVGSDTDNDSCRVEITLDLVSSIVSEDNKTESSIESSTSSSVKQDQSSDQSSGDINIPNVENSDGSSINIPSSSMDSYTSESNGITLPPYSESSEDTFSKDNTSDESKVFESVDNIVEKIETQPGKVLSVQLEEPTTLDAQVFQSIKDNSKRLEINIKESEKFSYTWSFDSEKISDFKDIDLSIDLLSENKSQIRKLAQNADVLIVSFADNGVLPCDTEIKINMPNIFDSEKNYYLYYYNPNSDALEYVDDVLLEGDGIKFIINHNSDFMISNSLIPGALNNPEDAGWFVFTPINMVLLMLSVIIVITIITGFISFFPRKSFVTVMPTNKPYYDVYNKITNKSNDKNENDSSFNYITSTQLKQKNEWNKYTNDDYYSDGSTFDSDQYSVLYKNEVWKQKDDQIKKSEFFGEAIVWCSDDSLFFNPDNGFDYNSDDIDEIDLDDL